MIEGRKLTTHLMSKYTTRLCLVRRSKQSILHIRLLQCYITRNVIWCWSYAKNKSLFTVDCLKWIWWSNDDILSRIWNTETQKLLQILKFIQDSPIFWHLLIAKCVFFAAADSSGKSIVFANSKYFLNDKKYYWETLFW